MISHNRGLPIAQAFLSFLLVLPVFAWADSEGVTIHLNEFQVETAQEIVKTGEILFKVINQGRAKHAFIVSKKENGHFKELKAIKPLAPGRAKEITLSLSPGTYELSCKIIEESGGKTVDHYKKGMRILFTVVKPLKIGGSGADLGTIRILADALKKSHPNLLVEVPDSLGSGGGIKAVLAGLFDIGLSTRPLKDAERKQGAREVRYAKTPFLFATTPNNAQSSLTHQDVVNIYNRSRTTWDDGSRIRIVLRPDTDSDIRILRRHFPEINPAPFTGKTWRGIPIAYTDQESAELIQTIPGGMGMTTLSLLLSEKRPLKPLSIDGVPPTPQTIADGSYSMSKTLSFILGTQPDPLVKIFLDFVNSEQGKVILKKTGHLILE